MPELPEVEVVRRGLAGHVVGHTLTAIEVLHERPVRSHPGGPAGFVADLVGRTVVDARRRGKYLWLPLDSGDAVLGHLGMSGQMLVQPVGAPAERHLRVRFELGDGPTGAQETGEVAGALPQAHEPLSVRHELRFVDQRMFGGLGFSSGGAQLPPEIAHIARDLLDPEFDVDDFVRRARRRTSGIKRLLLDQSLVSGIGNIYADEALWRAGIHGDRPADRLTATAIRELAGHARDVMTEALAQGGTSFDALYVNVNGQSGYFERSLNAYGREGEPCRRCSTTMRRSSWTNRSSYWCPSCQRPPRAAR